MYQCNKNNKQLSICNETTVGMSCNSNMMYLIFLFSLTIYSLEKFLLGSQENSSVVSLEFFLSKTINFDLGFLISGHLTSFLENKNLDQAFFSVKIRCYFPKKDLDFLLTFEKKSSDELAHFCLHLQILSDIYVTRNRTRCQFHFP